MKTWMMCYKRKINVSIILKASLLVLISLPSMSFSMSADKHIMAWLAMAEVPLKYGGLGGEIPIIDFPELQNIIDQPTGARGASKRHCETHNPQRMAELFKNRWHPKAIFNAVCIHNVLDMLDSGPTGVNGHNSDGKKIKEAQEAYDKIIAGKKVEFPKWAYKAGKLARIIPEVRDYLKEKAKNTYLIRNLGKVVKILPEIVKGTRVLIVAYETGKQVLFYVENGNIAYEEIVKGAGGALGGSSGAKYGAKVGSIIGGIIAGALTGSKSGALIGASVGTALNPGIGTAAGGTVGGVIGGIIGAVGGGYAGAKAGEYLAGVTFDFVVPVPSTEVLDTIRIYLDKSSDFSVESSRL